MERIENLNLRQKMFCEDWREVGVIRLRRKEEKRKGDREERVMGNREVFKNGEFCGRVQDIARGILAGVRDGRAVGDGIERLAGVFVERRDFGEFWKAGGVEVVLIAVDAGLGLDVWRGCSGLLADLTAADSVICEEMVKMGVLQRISIMIDSDDFETIDNCCWSLNNLIIDSKETSLSLINSDIYRKLLKLSTDSNILNRTKLVHVLSNLTQFGPNSPKDLLSIFVNQFSNTLAFSASINGMIYLTENNKENLIFLYEIFPEIIQKVSEKFNENFQRVSNILLNFSVFEQFTEELLANGIIPIIKNLMRSKQIELRKVGFGILKNLSLSAENHFSVLVADQALLSLLVSGIHENSFDLKFEVWNSLKTIANRLAFYHSGLYESLIVQMSIFLNEKNTEILMAMLETCEAIIRNSGDSLPDLIHTMKDLQYTEILSSIFLHKNLEVSKKAEFLLNQFQEDSIFSFNN